MRARALKDKQSRDDAKTPRVVLVPFGHAIHRAETRNPKQIEIKRQIYVDRSIYTGDLLREIRRLNGCGKSPRLLAIKAARRALKPRVPDWMLPRPCAAE